jgi:hypothetical protein
MDYKKMLMPIIARIFDDVGYPQLVKLSESIPNEDVKNLVVGVLPPVKVFIDKSLEKLAA